MIWDSFDAQSIKGKPVAAPAEGLPLIYDGTRITNLISAARACLFEDFIERRASAIASGTLLGVTGAELYYNAAPGDAGCYPYLSGVLGELSLQPGSASGNRIAVSLLGSSVLTAPGSGAFDVVMRASFWSTTGTNMDWALGLIPGAPSTVASGVGLTGNAIVIEKQAADTSYYGAVYSGGVPSRTAALGTCASLAADGYKYFRIRHTSSMVVRFSVASTFAELETATELTVTAGGAGNYNIALVLTSRGAAPACTIDLIYTSFPVNAR